MISPSPPPKHTRGSAGSEREPASRPSLSTSTTQQPRGGSAHHSGTASAANEQQHAGAEGGGGEAPSQPAREQSSSLASHSGEAATGASLHKSPETTPPACAEAVDKLPAAEARRQLCQAFAELQQRDARITQMQSTIRELAQRLSGLTQYADPRNNMEERLGEIQRAHDAEVQRLTAEAESARMESLESRVRLRAAEEAMKRRHSEDVNQRASELLDERTLQVNDQNFELMKDKVLLSKDVEAAQAAAATLSRANATLRQQYDLAASTEAELLARSVSQKREIAALKKQIRSAEDSFAKALSACGENAAAEHRAHATREKELTRQRDEARCDAARLQKELIALRAASTRLVRQRGDLEQFFHDALADVRARVLLEKRQRLVEDLAHTGSPSGTLTSATHTTSSTLRLDTQRQRLQLLTDGKQTMPSSSSFHNAGNTKRRVWGADAKGLPVLLLDSSKVSGKALPPIPGEKNSSSASAPPSRSAALAAGTYGLDDSGACDEDNDAYHLSYPEMYSASPGNTDMKGSGALSRVPDAPTWKEVQNVDIRDLAWEDKERVIRALFKRLRQQQQGAASRRRQEAPPSPANDAQQQQQQSPVENTSLVARMAMAVEDDVFLTQQ